MKKKNLNVYEAPVVEIVELVTVGTMLAGSVEGPGDVTDWGRDD